MGTRIQKRTKYLTVSAMLCALGVILLSLGSLIEVLDLTVAVLASILCIYAVIELRGAYPWLIWLVTSILSLLLLPQKTPAIFYACFAGFYPILKEKIEACRLRPVCWILKLLVFHASLGVICLAIFLFPEVRALLIGNDGEGLSWLPIALYGMGLVCFLLYDVALSKLITFYLLRFRQRFRIKD